MLSTAFESCSRDFQSCLIDFNGEPLLLHCDCLQMANSVKFSNFSICVLSSSRTPRSLMVLA